MQTHQPTLLQLSHFTPTAKTDTAYEQIQRKACTARCGEQNDNAAELTSVITRPFAGDIAVSMAFDDCSLEELKSVLTVGRSSSQDHFHQLFVTETTGYTFIKLPCSLFSGKPTLVEHSRPLGESRKPKPLGAGGRGSSRERVANHVCAKLLQRVADFFLEL